MMNANHGFLRRRLCGFSLAWVLAGCAGAARAATAPPTPAATAPTPPVQVRLVTEQGTIVVAVDLAHAPVSAGDFLRYVDRGLYAGASFYRTVRRDNDHGTPQIEVIQGGVAGDDTPAPPVAHETTQASGLRHHDGTLSLARGAVGTGSAAAFFICIGEQPGLDFGGQRNPDRQGFAAFGQVLEGMDVVRRIHGAATDPAQGEDYVRGQLLVKPVRILRAERVEPAPQAVPPGVALR
ncbi:peptidylprolyl isomerase [Ideonella azotifigens]|uniref:peptidylprolyl isomerase n=1 Tax=Ideonella azotifigens TaxID=513160 RepID=UPI001B874036|nr:peptidylprolyl isomerase [Ideonella azotifigens]MCD2342419.1 peptidylprolyl isomerase [Ideonella azotifigens]